MNDCESKSFDITKIEKILIQGVARSPVCLCFGCRLGNIARDMVNVLSDHSLPGIVIALDVEESLLVDPRAFDEDRTGKLVSIRWDEPYSFRVLDCMPGFVFLDFQKEDRLLARSLGVWVTRVPFGGFICIRSDKDPIGTEHLPTFAGSEFLFRNYRMDREGDLMICRRSTHFEEGLFESIIWEAADYTEYYD